MANGNSNLPVCVQLLNGTIAPGISVNYTLEYDISDSTQGDFSNAYLYCTDF